MGELDTSSTYSKEYANDFLLAKNAGYSSGAAGAFAEQEAKRRQANATQTTARGWLPARGLDSSWGSRNTTEQFQVQPSRTWTSGDIVFLRPLLAIALTLAWLIGCWVTSSPLPIRLGWQHDRSVHTACYAILSTILVLMVRSNIFRIVILSVTGLMILIFFGFIRI